MGGGGVMRAAAAAKVVGITAANGGFRGFAPDHPACAAARAAVRPVAASAISSASDGVRGVLSAPEIPAADGMPVKTPFLEFDDWEFSDGEESPPARLVFGSAPTIQEAKEATSDLKEAIENMFLVHANHFGSSQSTGGDLSSSFLNLKTQSRDSSDITVSAPPTPRNALQAFRFLSESATAQNVVASIASDPKVFAAVLENPELKQFIEEHKFSASSTGSNLDVEDCASDNGSSYLPPPRSTDKPAFRTRFADFFKKYLPSSPKSSDNETESRSKVADIYNKTKAAVTDMMSSLSDYFQGIFGGDDVRINADGAVEKTLGASILGLVIMVIMVVVLKRV